MAGLLYLYLLFHMFQRCFTASCYFPNHMIAELDVPCDPDAEASPCCAREAGNVCLENGLCQTKTGHRSRGSCSDKAWNSGKCPRYCLDQDTTGVGMISCARNTGNDTTFCCWNSPDSCCSSGMGRFDVLPSQPDVWATFDPSSNSFRVVSSSNSQSSAAPTGTSTADRSSSPATAEATATAGPSDSNSKDDGLSSNAKIGLGVGVPFGVIIILAGTFLLWQRRRRQLTAPWQTSPTAEMASADIARTELSGSTYVSKPATPSYPPAELPAIYQGYR